MAPKDKTELSDVERADLAAQAKRDAVPAPSATPAAVATVEHKPAVTFTPRTGTTKRGARYVADAELSGLFGNRPIVMGGFTLTLDGRDITVYMPGTQYSRSIKPRQIPIDGGPIEVNGKMVSHRDDPAGSKSLAALESAIRDAWADANASGEPFNREWPLSL